MKDQLTQEQQEIILHTMKGIADSQRQEIQYRNDMLDSMCRELNIKIPERRRKDRREDD